MSRHPVVQGVLSVSGTLGAVKGFQKLLQRYLSNDWLFESKKMQVSPTSQIPSSLVRSPENEELDWTRVLSFMSDQMANTDVRLLVAFLVLVIMGPLLPYLFGSGKREAYSIEYTEKTEVIASQIDPAERALLQFGKSKSEPLLFGYVSMELDDQVPHQGRHSELKLEKPEVNMDLQDETKVARQEPKELEGKEQQQEVEGRIGELESDISTRDKPNSSTKSNYTLSSAQTSPFDCRDSQVSQSNVCIQFSPIKTSNLDAQLTSAQAYSQPFTY